MQILILIGMETELGRDYRFRIKTNDDLLKVIVIQIIVKISLRIQIQGRLWEVNIYHRLHLVRPLAVKIY